MIQIFYHQLRYGQFPIPEPNDVPFAMAKPMILAQQSEGLFECVNAFFCIPAICTWWVEMTVRQISFRLSTTTRGRILGLSFQLA